MNVETATGRFLLIEPGSLDELRASADAGRLYAILDACDTPTVLAKVCELGEEKAVSLYRGMAEEEHAAIAPYLAHADGELVDWIEETLWEQPWGIFAVAQADLDTLRKHFRRFLIVEYPDGRDVYFRFYDPRVLRKFLPTCTPFALRRLFGPVQVYGVTDPETGDISLLAEPGRAGTQPQRVVSAAGPKLPIRREQLPVFQPEAEAAFVRRVMQFLWERHRAAVKGLSEEELQQRVETGVARGRRHGLTWQSTLTGFVALMFEIAPNFDEHPRIHAALTDEAEPPDPGFRRLMEETPDQYWEEAAEAADESVWLPADQAAAGDD